jgi:hypothetical protein
MARALLANEPGAVSLETTVVPVTVAARHGPQGVAPGRERNQAGPPPFFRFKIVVSR